MSFAPSRTCPKCFKMMRLWRIQPKSVVDRVDTVFFECDNCAFISSEDVARGAPVGRAS